MCVEGLKGRRRKGQNRFFFELSRAEIDLPELLGPDGVVDGVLVHSLKKKKKRSSQIEKAEREKNEARRLTSQGYFFSALCH